MRTAWGSQALPWRPEHALLCAPHITCMWASTQVLDAIIGLLCYVGFVVWRGRFKIYTARLVLPGVKRRPPAMRVDGHRRLW